MKIPIAYDGSGFSLAALQNHEAMARDVMSRLLPPKTEVKLVAHLDPALSEMQLACDAFNARAEAVMEVQSSALSRSCYWA